MIRVAPILIAVWTAALLPSPCLCELLENECDGCAVPGPGCNPGRTVAPCCGPMVVSDGANGRSLTVLLRAPAPGGVLTLVFTTVEPDRPAAAFRVERPPPCGMPFFHSDIPLLI